MSRIDDLINEEVEFHKFYENIAQEISRISNNTSKSVIDDGKRIGEELLRKGMNIDFCFAIGEGIVRAAKDAQIELAPSRNIGSLKRNL